jgi:hypothetical protein
MNVDKVIEKRSLDNADPVQLKSLQDALSFVDKKWSGLHASVTDYRDSLATTTQFYKLVEEVETWTEHKTEIIQRLVASKNECRDAAQAEAIDRQVDEQLVNARQFNDTKVKQLSQLASRLYGDEQGQKKVRYVVIRTIDLVNNFVQLKSDIKACRSQLANASTQTVQGKR